MADKFSLDDILEEYLVLKSRFENGAQAEAATGESERRILRREE